MLELCSNTGVVGWLHVLTEKSRRVVSFVLDLPKSEHSLNSWRRLEAIIQTRMSIKELENFEIGFVDSFVKK